MSNWKPHVWPRGAKSLASLVVFSMLVASFPRVEGWAKSHARKTERTTGGVSSGPLIKSTGATWTFAVSGDSRNCGDVVMPEIATGAPAHHAAFYWHLGDFRWGSDIDQDMAHEAAYRKLPMSISRYESSDWNDFIQNQLLSFGHMPVFLAIGNHELQFKTEEDYLGRGRDSGCPLPPARIPTCGIPA